MRRFFFLLLLFFFTLCLHAQSKNEEPIRQLDSLEAVRLDSMVNDRISYLSHLSCAYRIEMSNRLIENALPQGRIEISEDTGILITLGAGNYLRIYKGKMTMQISGREMSMDMGKNSFFGSIFSSPLGKKSRKVRMRDSVLEFKDHYLIYKFPSQERRKPRKKDPKYHFILVDKGDYSLNGFGSESFDGGYMRIYFSEKQLEYGTTKREIFDF